MLRSDIEYYLKENPGSTVDELNQRHYAGAVNRAGWIMIATELFHMISENKVRCEGPHKDGVKFYLV